jgi:putative DNA primase/helicase
MLEGTQIYLKYGLKHSPRMKSEILTYRNDSDMLGEFLEEEIRAKADVKIKQYLLFAAWKNWCERNEVRCGSKKSFTQRLAERGFRDSKSGDERFYLGLEKRAL